MLRQLAEATGTVLAYDGPCPGGQVGAAYRDMMAGEVAAACRAHLSLRLVDWSIRHQTPADADAWLDVAEELRPRAPRSTP